MRFECLFGSVDEFECAGVGKLKGDDGVGIASTLIEGDFSEVSKERGGHGSEEWVLWDR